ncbi:MAG TPA: hypothetical protein DEQ47_00080 [Solibacterales bacterium]|nr:hypothetical protein [Bryobacterales bacterium]
MKPTPFDPGLTEKFTGRIRRTIEKDGSFNVLRRGALKDRAFYLRMINASWTRFFALIAAAFLAANCFFGMIYFLASPDRVHASGSSSELGRFAHDFFFSVQTLTTVGYGNMYPVGLWANSVASAEALIGLLGFAVATGLLFGRFSRPSASVLFSDKALIAPYQDGMSLQFRIANRRSNELLELEINVLLMTVQGNTSELRRDYQKLHLERSHVYFFPLTWTIVHPIDESSPLYGKTPKDLDDWQAEFLILLKAFDDTFSQSVHARYSYRHEDLVWDARFLPAFNVSDDGCLLLDLHRVSAFVVSSPGDQPVNAS